MARYLGDINARARGLHTHLLPSSELERLARATSLPALQRELSALGFVPRPRLAGQALDTPCVESKTLGDLVGARVFLKFENHQFTALFKERGALNKLTRCSPGAASRV